MKNELLSKVSKLFLPHQYLRFFPPQFRLRKPLVSLIKKAAHQEKQIFMIVFQLEDTKQLRYSKYTKAQIVKTMKSKVCNHISDENILFVQQFLGHDITVFLSFSNQCNVLCEVDKSVECLTKAFKEVFQNITGEDLGLGVGYILLENPLENTQYKLEEGFVRAYSIAKKRCDEKYQLFLNEISNIIYDRNITLLSQPIYNVTTKQINGWEMLTRGPENTIYENPLQLFAIAKQTGFLYDLELLVVEETVMQVKNTNCRDQIFINITPGTLANPNFPKDILSVLKKFNVNDVIGQIVFELTERESFEEYPNLKTNIEILKGKGILLAIDDTGSGFANLNSITNLRPDIIKVDRSLIEDIHLNTLKETMLKGLLLIAEEAGSLVIAEGIECKDEDHILLKNGVDFAQGYYYSKPKSLPFVEPVLNT